MARILLQLAGALCLLVLAVPLSAQARSGAEWMRDCVRHAGKGVGAVRCAVRDTILLSNRAEEVHLDGGENGAVTLHATAGRPVGSSRAFVLLRVRAATATQADVLLNATTLRVSPYLSAVAPPLGAGESWHASYIVDVAPGASAVLQTRNGAIVLRGPLGRVNMSSINGPLMVEEGTGGNLSGTTINGPVSAQLSGERWSGKALDLSSVNGPVWLRLPSNFSAQLEVGTDNGPMAVNMTDRVALRGKSVKRITSAIGEGGALIRTVTTNGPVEIQQP